MGVAEFALLLDYPDYDGRVFVLDPAVTKIQYFEAVVEFDPISNGFQYLHRVQINMINLQCFQPSSLLKGVL